MTRHTGEASRRCRFISLRRDWSSLNGAETRLLNYLATKRLRLDKLRRERRDASSGILKNSERLEKSNAKHQGAAHRRRERVDRRMDFSSMGNGELHSFSGESGAQHAVRIKVRSRSRRGGEGEIADVPSAQSRLA